MNKYKIFIEDFKWVNDLTLKFLSRDYLLEGQSFEERVEIIITRFEELLGEDKKEYVEKFLEYLKRGYYSLSTPIWTNYGTNRGLPISCFGSYISDSMESILYGLGEIGMMSKYGGGTSAFIDVRERGASIKDNGASAGPFGFEELYDKLSTTVSQGNVRRGSLAMYMDIEHPDILEHLSIRADGNPIQDLSFGVCVSDDFMNKMIDGDAQSRKVWARVIESRFNTGYPYIFFTDTVNRGAPQAYKDKGLTIKASNLCSEICLSSSDSESFICCLSSMNALYYDEWKDTDAVEVLTYFLDTVIEDFIEEAENRKAKLIAEYHRTNIPYINFMDRAIVFAKRQRAIGVGLLGLASYYQSKMWPFESFEAKMANVSIFKTIDEKTMAATKQLATWFGEPDLLKGYGIRNATRMSVAPTKSSSFILGQVSEGIEPYRANSYIKDLAKVKHIVRNPFLTELLKEKGQNTVEVWNSIDLRAGSVQHLDFLSQHEKDVFKTMQEISPREIIIQAAARQKYIDQSASTNLMIHPSTPAKDVNALLIEAWRLGVKTLYYQHSVNAAQEFAREFMNECISCSA